MSAKSYEGKLIAPAKAKFAVIVSRFNEFVTNKLLGGAVDAFTRHGVKESDIEVVWSPGSFEIPLLAQRLAGSGVSSQSRWGRDEMEVDILGVL